MAATIKDIAKAANVSINTVSRALNNKPDVNKDTRERVLKIAEELEYVPNLLAKSLLSRSTKTVGVIVSDNTNPFYALVIKGIEDEARNNGYSIILCNTNEAADEEIRAIRVLQEKQVDGILMTPVQKDNRYLDLLESVGVPTVLLNRHPRKGTMDYVINDNRHGGYLAVQRLINIGRNRIACICGPKTISSAVERLEGAQIAMKEAGIDPGTLILHCGNLTLEDGYNTMSTMLDREPPDGLFAYSDLIAIGAMRAIREHGLRIPEDVAIVGYDDIQFSSFIDVPLTTIHQPRYEIGKEAVTILISRLKDNDADRRSLVLRPRLVIRESA